MNSTPPGNQPDDRAACAAWIASAVLPTPASPATADTTTAPAPPAGSSSAATCASSPSRPVNPAASGGSCASATGAAAACWVTNVVLVKSRPCSTGPLKLPPLTVLEVLPAAFAGHQPASGSSGRARRGRGRAERQAGEVPALQHRPVLDTAADRVRHVSRASPGSAQPAPTIPAAPARTPDQRRRGPAAPRPARPPSPGHPEAPCNAASSASPDPDRRQLTGRFLPAAQRPADQGDHPRPQLAAQRLAHTRRDRQQHRAHRDRIHLVPLNPG